MRQVGVSVRYLKLGSCTQNCHCEPMGGPQPRASAAFMDRGGGGREGGAEQAAPKGACAALQLSRRSAVGGMSVRG